MPFAAAAFIASTNNEALLIAFKWIENSMQRGGFQGRSRKHAQNKTRDRNRRHYLFPYARCSLSEHTSTATHRHMRANHNSKLASTTISTSVYGTHGVPVSSKSLHRNHGAQIPHTQKNKKQVSSTKADTLSYHFGKLTGSSTNIRRPLIDRSSTAPRPLVDR